jgi:ACR3 family arsenite efflux pump ArsB
MTGSQAVAPPAARKMQPRQAGLRQASLTILIVLIVQFALGISVNLYVTLPTAGHPGHASWFGNGPLLALHAALGMFLVIAAIFVLVRAIIARNRTLIVTSAAGLVAILLAAFFGSSFTDKLTNGYSLGMAVAFAVALACYAVGLYAASTRHDGHDRAGETAEIPRSVQRR